MTSRMAWTAKSSASTLTSLDSWWTGKRPVYGECPGISPTGQLHALPQLQLQSPTRTEILAYFDNTWTLTEVLFSALQDEAAFLRPPLHGLRHPLIFYYGHVAVLYVNKLRLAGLLPGPLNAELEQYLEVGVDEMSWDDLSKNERAWPSVAEVQAYRRQVYAAVRTLIETHPALDPSKAPFLEESPVWALAMAFEHERIHLETSSVLMRELPVEFVRRPQSWPTDAPRLPTPAQHVPSSWITVVAGAAHLGKPRATPFFGWDNEYGELSVQVPEFVVTSCLISNGEFSDFIAAGGYRESRYWSADGWRWKVFRNAKWPTFWVPDGPSALSGFKLRRLFDVRPMDPSLPAIVNFYEAQAYGRWRAEADGASMPYRLTTELEQNRLRSVAGPGVSGNINLAFGSESPVTAHVQKGIGDVYGNVWQWCEDPAYPLAGFKPHPYYEDFSTPCFDGKHQMILGGSFASTGDEATPWARFHFRPHFFQHAGFRLVKGNTQAPLAATATYENLATLAQYLELHYGEMDGAFPYKRGPREALGFPRRCAEVVIETARRLGQPMARALDLGCAVGGSTFELARAYASVTGVDTSAAFIRDAQRLKDHGRASYQRTLEGHITEPHEAVISASIDRSRVEFLQADAAQLPRTLEGFDAVLMANILCRLPNPRQALAQFTAPGGLLKSGGLLVLVSPYSWMADYTPKDQWLGGSVKDGKPYRSWEALTAFLAPGFELLHEDDIPLLIRDHARKYQYIVSHLTVWQKH